MVRPRIATKFRIALAVALAVELSACGSHSSATDSSATDTTVPKECRTYEELYRAHLAQLGPGAASVGESRMAMLTQRFARASATEQSRAELRASCSSAADALRAALR
jgi:hypothetical protein